MQVEADNHDQQTPFQSNPKVNQTAICHLQSLDEFLTQNEVEDAREFVVKKTKKSEKIIWMQNITKRLRNERESKEIGIGIQKHEG